MILKFSGLSIKNIDEIILVERSIGLPVVGPVNEILGKNDFIWEYAEWARDLLWRNEVLGKVE